MRLSLHTVICCCVFTTVLPPVNGATGEADGSLKKRLRVWLQSHMKRDLRSVTANEQRSDVHVGPQQDGRADAPLHLSSFGLNIRPKRSAAPKSSGCVLPTCLYNELIDRLVHMNNIERQPRAPEHKIGLNGYGRRRRRSLLDVSQLAIQTGRQRRSSEADQRVRGHKSTRTLV